jgi:hypothetical protein
MIAGWRRLDEPGGKSRMRTFVAVLTIALWALPAHAQQAGTKPSKLQSGEQKQEEKPKVDDRAYRNSLGNLPDKKFDPWKDMR